jgi:uncharacterized lipoprotein YmbA
MSRALGIAFLFAASIGCGSSPQSTFYVLSPVGGVAEQASPLNLKLRRPGIAGYLDRPEIVKRILDHRLTVTDTDRWGAPIDEMLGRVLALDLEQGLGGAVVFTEDGSLTADADLTIEVNVRELDMDAAGNVDLLAAVAIERGDAEVPLGTKAIHLRRAPSGSTTAALVSAMSSLVGELADQVALLVRQDESARTASAGPSSAPAESSR